MTSPLTTPWSARARRPLGVVRAVAQWPVTSQLNARRNALVASTHLTALSHERRQVEDFLDRHARRRQPQRAPRPSHPELVGPDVDAPPLRAAL